MSKFASDNNVFFEFHSHKCFAKDQVIKTVLLEGNLKNGLYVFDQSQVNLTTQQPAPSSPSFSQQPASLSPSFSTSSTQPSSSSSGLSSPSSFAHVVDVQPLPSFNCSVFELWHNRLGHPSAKIINTVLNTSNVSHRNKSLISVCSACCLGKIHKSPFSLSTTVYTEPLQLVHSDLWGPAPIQSSSGYKYYISFIDAFSRFTWIYMLRNKSDALQTFINFKNQVELQLGSKIKTLQSDWGDEYRAFTDFLLSHGIVHRASCPYVHDQNSVA